MPVVDASVVVEYVAGGEHVAEARSRILSNVRSLWAPHLVDAEGGHVLRRGVLAGEIAARDARAALHDLADLPLRRVAHVGLLDRAWALRANVSFHDAIYVALAERLDVPLVTLDARVAGVPGVRAVVDVIA